MYAQKLMRSNVKMYHFLSQFSKWLRFQCLRLKNEGKHGYSVYLFDVSSKHKITGQRMLCTVRRERTSTNTLKMKT